MVVAVFLLISAADAGTIFVDIAKIVIIKILTAAGDVDVPVAVLHENRYSLMGQIPSHIVKITFGVRGFDGQGQITTT